jgi:DNA-directed RNA polymerase beta' subunit
MKLDIFDINKFIQVNQCKEVTSHFALDSTGLPDPNGLFSVDIFGRFGSQTRKINFGYVDLKRKFLHPVVYNTIQKMYTNLPQVISGEKYVVLDGKGTITNSDEVNGYTGIDFFINNWKKINWNPIESRARINKEELLSLLDSKEIFIDKWIIIPAYYRDINLSNKTSGKISIDDLNALYIKMINLSNTESITFTASYYTQSSMQNTIQEIHSTLSKKVSGKHGIIRQAIMGKSIDYAATAVISAPKINSERSKDQQIPFNYIGVPLYLCCALFFPFVVKYLEDIFYDFETNTDIQLIGDKTIPIDDIVFKTLSSDTLQKLVQSYINDKTKMVRSLPMKLGNMDMTKVLKGYDPEKINRPFTLTDLLYFAVSDIIKNKHVLSSRYPITGAESIIVNKIKILTTERTINLEFTDDNGVVKFKDYNSYPYFPTDAKGNILHKEIRYIDTIVPNNAFLANMGGDYDGDTFRLIGLFSEEANQEAALACEKPMNFVDTNGNFTRGIAGEGGISLYMLTKD